MKKLILLTSSILLLPFTAEAGPFTSRKKMGDLYLAGAVFWAYGMTAAEDGWTGALQLTGSLVSSQLTVEGLKWAVKEERPDGSNDKSFPSGHTAGAFSGAFFVHKRYGWKPAVAPYVMASAVAWSRVDVRAHYWHDVVAGAAVSALFTWIFVDRLPGVSVEADTESVKLGFRTAF